ncbi:MAG: nucleotide exchange factor GrpE [Lachnospiraceae bacterium]|nr:nucleotide exchange factor GrpE [Lachnospiraceae bacterium]
MTNMAETNADEVLTQDEAKEQDTVETEAAEEAVQQEADEASSEAADTDQDEKKDKKGFFKKKKDKKDEQIEELNDRLKRNMAEFDNFRKRTEKEKAAMFEVGAKSVVEKILPVVDNFERGLATVPEEEKEAPFVQGMDKTYKQLMKMLEDMEVVPIEALGQEFDPAFHNAVMHVDDENAGDNVVVEEFQKGYTYRGNVVRFSMVKVAN